MKIKDWFNNKCEAFNKKEQCKKVGCQACNNYKMARNQHFKEEKTTNLFTCLLQVQGRSRQFHATL